jgi:hypothetical protein
MITMQIDDFLSSAQRPIDFDEEYLKKVENKVSRYASLMEKITKRQERAISEMMKENLSTKNNNEKYLNENTIKLNVEGSSNQIDIIIHQTQYVRKDIIEQEKTLYKMLENMCESTHNGELVKES